MKCRRSLIAPHLSPAHSHDHDRDDDDDCAHVVIVMIVMMMMITRMAMMMKGHLMHIHNSRHSTTPFFTSISEYFLMTFYISKYL